ncbi:MAG: putative selenate reductase subunit YgfK [Lysobacterales bacterium]
MSDLFFPISSTQLIEWVFSELESSDSIFGIPRQHFFVPRPDDPFRTSAFGQPLETPFGPAAGPHSQMAQNIIAAWLCGARYIELKTVQTLDELNVSKPCIDMQDEGYNVEWSQELKIYQSFDEYLRAWVLIHALHHKLGFSGELPGIVFNLSVGYNLEGIQKPNVQWFLQQMRDCSEYKQAMVEQVARFYPDIRQVQIPDRISNNVTLSTMHGCPPDEIEKICAYLMEEQGLHTYVKCNPTLLGPGRVRTLLHDDLGYTDVVVPDIAFEHDLKYADAIPMLRSLKNIALKCGLHFGVKLSNTLEVENSRTVFNAVEKMSYLSGRPLHAITVNLAAQLSEEFDGDLPMSFSAGADCFNAADLLAAGMQTITVCSDLLKTGGYLRLLQYIDLVREAFMFTGAADVREYAFAKAFAGVSPGGATPHDIHANTRINLNLYAMQTRKQQRLQKSAFLTSRSKTQRKLGLFDCIEAPCIDRCAIDQKVPQYMNAVRDGNFEEARHLTLVDNPIAATLGRVCDHLCETTCIRTHLDEPLAIRDIKRFIMDSEPEPGSKAGIQASSLKVAIIGAGPGGMAAASELALAGCAVEIFEMHAYAGGMVGGAIPEFRLPRATFNRDLQRLNQLGVKIHYEVKAGRDIRLSQLRRDGFDAIVIMVGAQLGKKLGLEGEDSEGVMDALYFLRQAREGKPVKLGQHVGIIGAGDTAMDCARTAWRLSDGRISVIYRRTIDQMPADREEVALLSEEGIDVVELAKPQKLLCDAGKLRGLICSRMEFRGERDASGRKIPFEVPASGFEIPVDTLILAISQHAILDFFDEEPIETNQWGYIKADPVSFETSVPGVYAGGDVVNDGPSSIVEAVADGKAIAASILGRSAASKSTVTAFDTAELLRKRSIRQWRVPVSHTPLEERHNASEVVRTFTKRQAQMEADRCLDCHKFCSLCVGVCPNFALQTWKTEPFELQLPQISIGPDGIETQPGRNWSVEQAFQIAVLADLCNECGNCTTFCPTAGEPYRDKPRLYLERDEFSAQQDNAFMVFRTGESWMMEARWQGETHHLELKAGLEYRGPLFSAQLERETFKPLQIDITEKAQPGDELSLEPAAAMYVLLNGLKESLPHLPVALPAGHTAEGKIPHPGYVE